VTLPWATAASASPPATGWPMPPARTPASQAAPTYMVAVFDRKRIVCEVGSVSVGLTAQSAVQVARELRAEFPGAVVAILRSRPWNPRVWPWRHA
jgi:hypothetical protein